MTNQHALGQLGSEVRVVQLNLRTNIGGQLPVQAWNNSEWIGDKNAAKANASTQQETGERFIAQSERATIFVGFSEALKRSGYTLVHVGKRIVNTEDGKTQYVLRYTFGCVTREEKHLRRLGEELSRELEVYAAEALWNVQAFRNPYYRDGMEVEGQRVITIDINARKPLFEMKEGKQESVMVWSGGRDKMGKGVGEKVPLAAKLFLDVSDEGEIAIFVNELIEIPDDSDADTDSQPTPNLLGIAMLGSMFK